MAGKRKLEHFAEMKSFPHVFEPSTDEVLEETYTLSGKWHAEVFKNDKPIVLELGCGKGEYSCGLAEKFPHKNFIGIDIKGARMWTGAKYSLDLKLKNIAFLRTRIEFIQNCFAKNEIDEIWITFPDPQAKDRREKKRLTGPLFIDRYRKFLKPGGLIHLKTDSAFFYTFTLEELKRNKYPIIEATDNLYSDGMHHYDQSTKDILSIKTHYEKLFSAKGHAIHYLKFKIDGPTES